MGTSDLRFYISLDPYCLKLNKKPLAFWLNLKGGEGFSCRGTQFHQGPLAKSFFLLLEFKTYFIFKIGSKQNQK